MANPCYVTLPARGILAVEGADAGAFLQGLISNDVRRVAPDRAIYAALLTPQGKYLHDFFVFMAEENGAMLIDCERPRLADLQRRLKIYKLRSDVRLTDRSEDFAVAAVFGAGTLAALDLPATPGRARAFGGGIAFADPRLAEAGARAVLPSAGAAATLEEAGCVAAEAEAYDRHRLELGLADGSRDLVVEKSILLENGFDELGGVDWEKGCYMGQELTARTKYRGLVKKRLMPVIIDGPAVEPGTPVEVDGKDAGECRSSRNGIGLALLRLDAYERALAGAPLTAGGARLTPKKPEWARF